MIQIVLLDGPFAGQVRTSEELPPDKAPDEVLGALALQGWAWRIIWPAHPADAQSWAQDWLHGLLEEVRDTFGVDLTGAVLVTVEAPPVEELMLWVRADLIARITLASVQGRGVRFGGRRWELPDPREPDRGERYLAVIAELGDAISTCGQLVGVLTDGTEGDLVIGMAGPDGRG